MNTTSLKSLLIIGSIATILGGNITPIKAEQEIKFFCGTTYEEKSNSYKPTTFIWHPRGKIRLIQWEKKLGGKSPEKRCIEVSQNWQTTYSNGNLGLTLITNGKMNGNKVICTAKKSGGKCDNLLMTLRKDDNSLDVLNHLRDILSGYQVGPVKHSSGEPQIYYQIDFNNFLKNAPVEK